MRPRIIHVLEGHFRAFSSRFILHFDSQESLLRPSIHIFNFIKSKLPRLTSYHNYFATKMSDEFSKCSSSFKKEIALSGYPLFHKQASFMPSTSQDRQYRKNLDYIDLLEGWVLVYWLTKIA